MLGKLLLEQFQGWAGREDEFSTPMTCVIMAGTMRAIEYGWQAAEYGLELQKASRSLEKKHSD